MVCWSVTRKFSRHLFQIDSLRQITVLTEIPRCWLQNTRFLINLPSIGWQNWLTVVHFCHFSRKNWLGGAWWLPAHQTCLATDTKLNKTDLLEGDRTKALDKLTSINITRQLTRHNWSLLKISASEMDVKRKTKASPPPSSQKKAVCPTICVPYFCQKDEWCLRFVLDDQSIWWCLQSKWWWALLPQQQCRVGTYTQQARGSPFLLEGKKLSQKIALKGGDN